MNHTKVSPTYCSSYRIVVPGAGALLDLKFMEPVISRPAFLYPNLMPDLDSTDRVLPPQSNLAPEKNSFFHSYPHKVAALYRMFKPVRTECP